MHQDDLSRFCCQNPQCPDYGKRNASNLSVCMRYGAQQQYRFLYCSSCQGRFSERKGTPLFDARLPHDKLLAVLKHLADGCGVRQTSRLVGVHRDTVVRLNRLAGQHARQLHDELVAFSPRTREVQLDEKWSFVGKKEKQCDPERDPDDVLRGDQWDLVAYDPEHRLVLSAVVGKRLEENAELLLQDVKGRLNPQEEVLLTSDEWSAYPTAIQEVLGEEVIPERTGKPGRPAGPRQEVPETVQYATVHKVRKKNRVVEVKTSVVFGTAMAVATLLALSTASTSINTSFVERQHATDRHRNARKARKTYRFSKDWEVHEAATHFTLYSYNFCWTVRTLRQRDDKGHWQQRTPAMAAGLTDHVWSLEEWLSFPAVQRK